MNFDIISYLEKTRPTSTIGAEHCILLKSCLTLEVKFGSKGYEMRWAHNWTCMKGEDMTDVMELFQLSEKLAI